jgi:hypothetical protein
MRRSFWLLFVLAGLAAATAGVTATAAPDGDELERNRRLLDKWKADPDHAQRLQRDLAAFYALPAERQERIRLLDRQLHDIDPSNGARLWGVLERYLQWLQRLTEEERRTVLEAPTPDNRLAVIRGLKQREWLTRLPAGLREKLLPISAERRAERMRALRLEERRRRVLWERPFERRPNPIPRPKHHRDFPLGVQAFIRESLRPRLSPGERLKLDGAEGKWPQLPRVVARLADRHPVLPPAPNGEITHFKDLPDSIRNALEGRRSRRAKVPAQLEDKWPEFALAVSNLYRRERGKAPPPLGACKPDEFPRKVQDFLRGRLFPALSQMEKASLDWLEGRWPEYPLRLLRLARQKHLPIPGMSLPGPPELWESAFLDLHELSLEERESLDVIAFNPLNNTLKRIKEWAEKPHRKMGRKGPRFRHGGR